MNIVLFGKPGAGKGTQATLLADSLGLPTLATGDVLRAAVREGTPLGKAAKAAMDRGDLVPDDVILGIMKDTLAKPEYSRGVILDGVVRTVPQAKGLEQVFSDLGRAVDVILAFDVDNEEIVQRLSGRTVCEKCQTPYTGREPGTSCDKCGGTLVRRRDDEPNAVRRRLEVYETQTAPVFEWYRGNGTRVAVVDAVGSVTDVTTRALRALER
jgi:adenylate kinase